MCREIKAALHDKLHSKLWRLSDHAMDSKCCGDRHFKSNDEGFQEHPLQQKEAVKNWC